MDFKSWMKQATQAERVAVAKRADTSIGYLWQIAGGHTRVGVLLAKKLAAASQVVTPEKPISREYLRPDVWDDSEQ